MTLDAILSTAAFVVGVVTVGYFLLVNGTYISLTLIAVEYLRDHRDRRSYQPVGQLQANRFLPEIAVIVPAYNEEAVVVDSVTSLLALEYPAHEVIVVNDGSTDGTAGRLIERFDMKRIDASYPIDLPCEPITAIYRAPEHDVTLLDKENGGKSDALNAGVHFTDRPLFCAIDADSLIERGALRTVVEPFLTEPTRMVATGGAVRIANGTTFRKGSPQEVDLPTNRLVRLQAVEYLRAFLIGRIGLSRIGGLLIISGAFGLFKTDVVREIGGYDTDCITEDMELVVRLHRHLIDEGREYEMRFLAEPVVWTEVPESLAVLSRQRRRWFRGLLDTLVKHRDVIGRPSYGIVGLFALPFFLVIEAIGPLVEGGGYLLVPLLVLTSLLNVQFFAAFLLVAVGLGILLSTLAVIGEVITYRRYEDPTDIVVLLWYTVLESIAYRPWRAFVSWRGAYEYVTGDDAWGEMTRAGFSRESDGDERGDAVNELNR